MHREGISLEALPEALVALKKHPRSKLEGLMSHLALAEDPNDKRTLKQLGNFQKALKYLTSEGFTPKWVHLNASSGLLRSKSVPSFSVGNVARAGISIYGFDPKSEDDELRPVMELRTKIIQIKNLKMGESLGYDFTFTASRNMVIGILPIGYFDGVDRRLSNIGSVLVDGFPCRILGLVSMNITDVDLSEIKDAKVGRAVTIISSDPKEVSSVSSLAKLLRITPYGYWFV
jgi:alanine racemase